MKKGMFVRSFFVIGVLMFFIFVSVGNVMAYTETYTEDVFNYDGAWSIKYWPAIDLGAGSYHINYGLTGSVNQAACGIDGIRVPTLVHTCDSGYTCIYKSNDGAGHSFGWCEKKYNGGTVVSGGWSGFDGNYKCFGQTILGRKNAYVTDDGFFYKWDTVTSCSSPWYCVNGQSSCKCDASSSCAASTCTTTTCSDSCGNIYTGTKAASCVSPSTVCSGVAISSTSGCGTCPSGTKDCTPPTQDLITVSSPSWEINGSSVYSITAKSTDVGVGIGGIYGILVLINHQGSNAGNYGGYFSWHPSSAHPWRDVFNSAGISCIGGGYAYKSNNAGSDKIDLVSCTSSIANNQRTVTFNIKPKITFPILNQNDISLFASDSLDNTPGTWVNFDLNFRSYKCLSGVCCNIAAGIFNDSTTICRQSTGPCDITEKCTGSSSICPLNVFNDSTTICNLTSAQYCKNSTALRINVTKCSGNAATCPSTPIVFDDTSCSISPYLFCSQEEGSPAASCTKIGITEAYWALLNGTRVTTAAVNDTVLMMVNGNGLSGQMISYSIYKDSWWPWPSPLNTEDTIGFSSYKTNDTGDYYFKTEVGGFEKTSEMLRVGSGGGGPGQGNKRPVTRITLPISEMNVSVGENIIFNVSSHDEDDLLKITWDFGDDKKHVITNYVDNSVLSGNFNTSANVTHNYSASGRYLIKLTAKEMERDQEDSKEIYVNVFNTGINVFPVISSPKEGEIYENKIINFNASSSRVINCSTSHSCPGGGCFNIGGLTCYNLLPYVTARQPYNLFLKWTVEEGSNTIQLASGNWFDSSTSDTKNMGVINFYHYFFVPNERTVKLYMEYRS